MQNPASLRSDRWQLSHGMGGRLRVDWVAAFAPESVAAFSGIRNAASAEGYPVTKELVERLSPYMREHIRRFGQYVLDMDEVPEPLGPEALRLGL